MVPGNPATRSQSCLSTATEQPNCEGGPNGGAASDPALSVAKCKFGKDR